MSSISAYWRKHFLPISAFAALVLTDALGFWLHFSPRAQAGTLTLLQDNRPAIYGALSAIWGSLLGFGIAALSIAMAFSQDPRMKIVRRSNHYQTMWDVFTKNIFAMSLATLLALAALVVDKNNDPVILMVVFVAGSSLFACFRLATCIWLLEKLVLVIRKKKEDGESPAAPATLG